MKYLNSIPYTHTNKQRNAPDKSLILSLNNSQLLSGYQSRQKQNLGTTVMFSDVMCVFVLKDKYKVHELTTVARLGMCLTEFSTSSSVTSISIQQLSSSGGRGSAPCLVTHGCTWTQTWGEQRSFFVVHCDVHCEDIFYGANVWSRIEVTILKRGIIDRHHKQ